MKHSFLKQPCIFQRVSLFVLLVLGACGQPHTAASETGQPVLIADGLTYPWGMDWLPDGRMLITEKQGRLRLLAGKSLSAPISGPSSGLPRVDPRGQGGLLDVAVHPDFAHNRLIYLCYSTHLSGTVFSDLTTAIYRGKLSKDSTHLETGSKIFQSNHSGRGGSHYGCRLRFGPDGYLYASLGERGERDLAQDPSQHPGSILRLTDGGAAAPGNPKISGAAPEIWSFGHRNPQGLAFRGDQLWSHEHGPRGGDEVNKILPGHNYGWPIVSFGREYYGPKVSPSPYASGVTPPVWQWTPSVAPSGMDFITSDRYPGWNGNLIVGTLKYKQLERLVLKGDQIVDRDIIFKDKIGRIRAVKQGPDGYLYLLNDTTNAGVYRLEKIE